MLNCTFVEPIMADNVMNGVIIENKESRQAILAKITIDATGDGDVFARAGAPFKEDIHPTGLSLSYRVMNVNVEKAVKFREEKPEKYMELINEHVEKEGYGLVWLPTTLEGCVLFFQYLRGLSATKVEDLTRAEKMGYRDIIKKAGEYYYLEHVHALEQACHQTRT